MSHPPKNRWCSVGGRGRVRRCLVIVVLVGLCACLASSASAAPAGPTTCEGTLSGGPYFGIIVPEGAHCDLFTANVVGDVMAAPGSAINISIHSTINGDVTSDGALVQIINSVVVGNVAIARAPDSATGVSEVAVMDSTIVGGSITVLESVGSILIDRNLVINGDISVTSNFVLRFVEFPSQLSVRLNHVHGNVTVSNNAGPGSKEAHSNTVTGTLACLDNEQPFVGGPNSAGSTVGDCF